jgi:hypothetical protein
MRFIDWLKDRLFPDDGESEDGPIWQSRVHAAPKPRVRTEPAEPQIPDFAPDLGGKVVDGGPGKNVLIRNKYVREDTGTHETLKIVDDSLLETDEEFGADPYNTGRFDRSKSWDTLRSRK